MHGDELGARRLRLEQGQRLREQLLAAGIADRLERDSTSDHDARRGHGLAPFPVKRERFFECLQCLPDPALLLLRGLRPALEQ